MVNGLTLRICCCQNLTHTVRKQERDLGYRTIAVNLRIINTYSGSAVGSQLRDTYLVRARPVRQALPNRRIALGGLVNPVLHCCEIVILSSG